MSSEIKPLGAKMTKKKPHLTTSAKTKSLQELARETKKILRLKEAIARNFWDLGTALCRVHDKELHQLGGHKFFEDYLKKEVKIGRSTAYRLMELSKNFSRDTAIRYGKEKLLGAIDYAKATHSGCQRNRENPNMPYKAKDNGEVRLRFEFFRFLWHLVGGESIPPLSRLEIRPDQCSHQEEERARITQNVQPVGRDMSSKNKKLGAQMTKKKPHLGTI